MLYNNRPVTEIILHNNAVHYWRQSCTIPPNICDNLTQHRDVVTTILHILFFFAHPIYCRRTFYLSFFVLSRNSDPGSLSRLFTPLPTTVRDFTFFAARLEHFSSFVDWNRIALPLTICANDQQTTLLYCVHGLAYGVELR